MTYGNDDFVPVILGTNLTTYTMARSLHEAFGVRSLALGRFPLGATVALLLGALVPAGLGAETVQFDLPAQSADRIDFNRDKPLLLQQMPRQIAVAGPCLKDSGTEVVGHRLQLPDRPRAGERYPHRYCGGFATPRLHPRSTVGARIGVLAGRPRQHERDDSKRPPRGDPVPSARW